MTMTPTTPRSVISPTTQAGQPAGAALDAFIAVRSEIDAMLERLRALSDDHFNTCPDEISWGHVGTITGYRDRLREIADSAFGEGEYAP